MIKTIALGTLGRDAELATSKAGKTYCKFSVAVNKKKKDKEETQWISCLLFGNYGAALASYLVKGTKVYIEGEPSVSTYMDKNGQSQVSYSMICSDVQLVGERREKQQNVDSMAQWLGDMSKNDDIPF